MPGPGEVLDYSKARVYHWLHSQQNPPRLNSGILESTKAPLENRVWYAYPGQPGVAFEGTHAQPT